MSQYIEPVILMAMILFALRLVWYVRGLRRKNREWLRLLIQFRQSIVEHYAHTGENCPLCRQVDQIEKEEKH